ncbi:hypothetical protein BS47DRAFT_1295570, partial [Hydnum rufescens UP504]
TCHVHIGSHYATFFPEEDIRCSCSEILQTCEHILQSCILYEEHCPLLGDTDQDCNTGTLLGLSEGNVCLATF